MLLSINGTTVTLVVDNSTTNFLSFAFNPRVIDGYSYALNTGMVGIGANNSRAQIDNVAVQVLPPTFTLQETETFADGVANLLTGSQVGQWTVASGRDTGTPAVATGFAASNFDLQLVSPDIDARKLEIGGTLIIKNQECVGLVTAGWLHRIDGGL